MMKSMGENNERCGY